MKKFVFIIAAAILGLALLSCNKVNSKRDTQRPNLTIWGEGTHLSMTKNSTTGDFVVKIIDEAYIAIDSENYSTPYLDIVSEYVKKDSRWPNTYSGPLLSNVTVRSGVKVYADVPLFGLAAGENLLQHFTIGNCSEYHKLICTYPDFSVIGLAENGMPLADYLLPGTALFGTRGIFSETVFSIAFASTPEDLPAEYTLSLEIPVTTYYESSGESGDNNGSRTLVASTHVN